MLQKDALSDHVHAIAIQDGRIERVGQFDWDEVYRNVDGEEREETAVSFSDMSAVFSLILEWMLKAETLQLVGARAAALAMYLDPVNNNRFGSSLLQIAEQAGSTRAALSKSLIDFRRAAGVHLSMGKGSETTDSYRACQIKSLEAGTHSSFNRKDLKQQAA